MNPPGTNTKKKTLSYPFYVLLLPVFFVFHGFTDNFYFVSPGSAAILTLVYLTSALLLTAIFFLVYRDLRKAALFSFILLLVYFLFGILLDLLLKHFRGAFFVKYSFLLSALAVICVIIFLAIRRSTHLTTLTRYLNVLFITLVLIDAGSLLIKTARKNKPAQALNNIETINGLSRPDIYLVMLDGYAGEEQLQDCFHYSNKPFFDSLAERGFRTLNKTYSNYNYTPYSTASTLTMDYIDTAGTGNQGNLGYKQAARLINQNNTVQFLKSLGYDFFNHSIFKVDGQAAPTGGSFIPANARLVNSTTLLSRLEKDVLPNVATKLNITWYLKKEMYATLKDNNTLYDLTLSTAAQKSSKPKFVYTHLLMPHHPYYFDRNGERSFASLLNTPLGDTAAYLAYTEYTNAEILRLVDAILKESKKPPIIILMSDHGFRYFPPDKAKENYVFSNLISVCMPGGKNEAFTDGLHNVNFFRILFNTAFQQKLPLLPEDRTAISF